MNKYVLCVSRAQLDNIYDGLRKAGTEVADEIYNCLLNETIRTQLETRQVNIADTVDTLQTQEWQLNGKPGQMAQLVDGDAWYQILQKRINQDNEVEYELYTRSGWVPAELIKGIRDNEPVYTIS